jgi:hypothetical protein
MMQVDLPGDRSTCSQGPIFVVYAVKVVTIDAGGPLSPRGPDAQPQFLRCATGSDLRSETHVLRGW